MPVRSHLFAISFFLAQPLSQAHAQERLADAPTSDPAMAGIELRQNLAAPPDVMFGVLAGGFEERTNAPNNDADAARFLTQATFGPTQSSLGELKSIGYSDWIDQQISLPASLQRPVLEAQVAADIAVNPRGVGIYRGFRMERWFATALGAPDQLRQRMGFALSQITVISDGGSLADRPIGIAEFNDIMLRNAFGSYRTLLREVTYSPMMGEFLTTLRNRKTDWTLVSGVPTPDQVAPDENYSREIMQLFSIGLIKRNRDFTPQLVGGLPVPTYSQDIITQTAKAFTGLGFSCSPPATFGSITLNHNCGTCVGIACNFSTTAYNSQPQRYVVPATPQAILTGLWHPDTYRPMACYPRYADTGRFQTAANAYAVLPQPFDRKLIIDNVTINASTAACYATTPAVDQPSCSNYCTDQVNTVVDTLSLHQNAAPFIARQLIQRFTTSNPSSQYIDRVAAVFENDGSNQRGNLGAVIKAVLLDTEARANTPSANFGKLREPLLRLTAIWRGFGVQPAANGQYGVTLPERAFVQRPLGAPSVFNFYEPDFQQAGDIAAAGLVSPEFQILDESTTISASDELWRRVFSGYSVTSSTATPFVAPTTGAYLPPEILDNLPANAGQLIEALNVRLMSGRMSSTMKTKMIALIDTGGPMAAADARRKALSMIHLIAISPEFALQR